MKKFTQSDFENFPVDEYGYKICPPGDYTAIRDFGNGCSFGNDCRFGNGCRFGEWCSFGNDCRFGNGCRFGEWCRFGNDCSFGNGCSFGECCRFGDGCRFESGKVQNGKYIAIDRIGSCNRKAYFFVDDNGKMYVRAGCWFSDIDEFKERVKKVHAGTIHEKAYLAACDLAELMLKEVEE